MVLEPGQDVGVLQRIPSGDQAGLGSRQIVQGGQGRRPPARLEGRHVHKVKRPIVHFPFLLLVLHNLEHRFAWVSVTGGYAVMLWRQCLLHKPKLIGGDRNPLVTPQGNLWIKLFMYTSESKLVDWSFTNVTALCTYLVRVELRGNQSITYLWLQLHIFKQAGLRLHIKKRSFYDVRATATCLPRATDLGGYLYSFYSIILSSVQ